MSVYVEEHGAGDRLLLLLHGMSCTGAAWRAVVDALDGLWQGRIAVADLPGHGASDPLDSSTFDSITDAVAGALPPHTSLVVVGHSFGGALATRLASGRFGVSPTAVAALGVKVHWTEDELAGALAYSAKPPRWFESRDEAEQRYCVVSGLPEDPALLMRGVAEVDGRFRLAADPRVAAVGAPDMAAWLAEACCSVELWRGERDPMVSAGQLQALGVPTREIADAGHNAHVDQSKAVAQLIAGLTRD